MLILDCGLFSRGFLTRMTRILELWELEVLDWRLVILWPSSYWLAVLKKSAIKVKRLITSEKFFGLTWMAWSMRIFVTDAEGKSQNGG
jgi:hypothetical protein